MAKRRAEALYDFNPTADVELKIEKGDMILVRRMSVGEGWWEGELNSLRGLFPSSYVKLLPVESPPQERPVHVVLDSRPKTPLTPGNSKKVFMESMIAPTALQQDRLYSKEKASELFVRGHSDVGVTVGPSWDCQSPSYSITVRHQHAESSRVSGLKRWSSYIVETKQLASRVVRKFKHFLWLYDKLAELFPCISLPPLPVKQYSGPNDPDGVEARRRGLERFLARVSGHPVLGSTKLLHTFLTTSDDKDWKIGRQNSNIKLPKSAKKLFGAPVYNAVRYPAYNLPLNQLASIDKFSKFTRQLETNVNALESSYLHVSGTNVDMLNSLNLLGRDIQRFTKGQRPTTGAKRRKLLASCNVAPGLPNGGGGNQAPFHVLPAPQKSADLEEDESGEGEEGEEGGEWNWREDARFSKMAQDLHSISGSLRQVSQLGLEHQEVLEMQVLDVLREYSGIIHTLPVLVKLHEEAMEMFDTSKEKDSKKEAEVVRKHCDTLNNILLSEFDHFSRNMVQDFEGMMEGFLQEQANFHRQLADQWDDLHRRYSKRLSSRRQSNAKVRSSGANSAHSLGRGGKSGSFTASLPSSGNSSPSLPDVSLPSSRLDTIENTESPQFGDSFDEEESAADTTVVPSYISVERKFPVNQSKYELSESDIIDPEILVPKKKSVPEPPFKPAHLHGDVLPKSVEAPPLSVSSSGTVGVPVSEDPHYDNYKPRVLGSTPPGSGSKVMDSIVFLSSPTPEYDNCKPKAGDKIGGKGGQAAPSKTVDISVRYETAYPRHIVTVPQEVTTPPDSTPHHEYANLEFGKPGKNLPQILQAVLGEKSAAPHTKSSPTASKKPMPIQRKRNQSDPEEKDLPASGSSVATDTAKSPSQNRSNVISPRKPVPPVKPPKLQSGSDDIATSSSGGPSQSPAAKEGMVTSEVGGVSSGQEGVAVAVPKLAKTRPHSSSLAESIDQLSEGSADDELSVSLGTTKPRRYTNVDQRPDLKKQKALASSSSIPSPNLVVFGQIRLPPDPAPSTDSVNPSGRAQSKTTSQVSVPTSLHDSQPPQRSKVGVMTKPVPPSKARVLASSAVLNAPKPLAEKSTQVNVAARSKAAPPPKPSRAVNRANSGGVNQTEEDISPKGHDELMRKLSRRRMRIEEQIAGTVAGRTTSPANSDNSVTLESASERTSSLSSSSSLSEVVVAYHSKKPDGSSVGEQAGKSRANTSPIIEVPSGSRSQVMSEEEGGAGNGGDVNTREPSLAKFGIIEEVSGRTYVI